MGRWLDWLKQVDDIPDHLGYAGDALGTVVDVLNIPLDYSKEAFGAGQYGVARALRGAQNLPGPLDAPFDLLAQIPAIEGDLTDLLAAYEQGYNGRTGGRGVWEQMVSDDPLLVRAGLDVGADPLAWAGGIGAAGRAIKAASAARRGVPALALRETGSALQGAGRLLGVPDVVGSHIWKGVSKGVSTPAKKILGTQLDLSPQDKLNQHLDEVWTPWMEFVGSERAKVAGSPVGYGHAPILSDDANTMLKKSYLKSTPKQLGMFVPKKPKLKKGEVREPDPPVTYLDALKHFRVEAARVREVLEKSGIDPNLQGEDLLNAVRVVLPQEEKAIKRFVEASVDPFDRDSNLVAYDLLKKVVEKESGIKLNKRTKYDLFRGLWTEQALASPKYLWGNLLGGYIQNAISGHPFIGNLVDMARSVNRVAKRDGRWFDPEQTSWAKTARKYGMADADRAIYRPSGAREVIGYRDNVRSLWGEQAGKVIGKRGGNIVGKPFEAVHTIAAGIDLGHRGSVWNDVVESEMTRYIPEVRAEIDRFVAKHNKDAVELEDMRPVRLYRAQDLVLDQPLDGVPTPDGLWFTRDPEAAHRYMQQNRDAGRGLSRMDYVDLPRGEANRYLSQDPANPRPGEYLVPMNVAQGAKPVPFQTRVYHGSPRKNLRTISAHVDPKQGQFGGESNDLGAYFTTDLDEAEGYASHWAGKQGRVYTTNLRLNKPYVMNQQEIERFWSRERMNRGPDSDASKFRKQLEAQGYDGIVRLNSYGSPWEIISFQDVPLPNQGTKRPTAFTTSSGAEFQLDKTGKVTAIIDETDGPAGQAELDNIVTHYLDYGEGDDLEKFVAEWTDKVKAGGPIVPYGDLVFRPKTEVMAQGDLSPWDEWSQKLTAWAADQNGNIIQPVGAEFHMSTIPHEGLEPVLFNPNGEFLSRQGDIIQTKYGKRPSGSTKNWGPGWLPDPYEASRGQPNQISAWDPNLSAYRFPKRNNKPYIDLTDWSMPTTPEGLKFALKEKGLSHGQADHLGRMLANKINLARREGRKALDKSQFSYLKTNLDRKIEKVWPFHYWTSRATRLYAEEMISHPLYILNYLRMQEGLDRAYEDPGLSARQKGFLKLFETPTGFTLFANPTAMMASALALGITPDSYEPDGETTTGKLVRTLKQYGVGMYPWFNAMFNAMGTYGDTFEPDPIGFRHQALIGSVINKAASEGWLGIDEPNPWYATAGDKTRALVSKWASMALPDWLAQPVEMAEGGPNSQITLDSIIESRIIAENPDLTNGEMVEIMSDPDDPRYQSAFADAANAGLISQVINFTMPLSVKTRENSREVRSRALSTIREQADELGVPPWELTPTMGDAQFAATYEKMTGKEFAAGDYSRYQFQSDLTRASPRGQPFVVWEQEYNALGDPQVRAVIDKKEEIASGRYVPPGFAAPRSLDEARLLADRWAALNGYQPLMETYTTLRRAYRSSHPEFDQYMDWKGQMYDLLGLYGSLEEYRQRTAAMNPNFARYLQDQQEQIRRFHADKTPEEQLAELDRRTMTADAWFAVMGQSFNRYDPAPISAGGYYDPQSQMLPQQPSYGGFPTQSTIGDVPGGLPSGGWQRLLQRYV